MIEKKNSKSESQEKQPKFNQEQYDRLIECSKRKGEGIKEWNDWYYHDLNENPDLAIHLEGAQLRDAYLKGAELSNAHLEDAVLAGAHLEGARLNHANLKNANLWGTHLEDAKLADAHLEGAELANAHLEDALLARAHLENTDFIGAHLEGANFSHGHLEGANFMETHLEGAIFRCAIVNGSTFICDCFIGGDTDFTMVGLDDARIEPGLKQSLKNNIRKKRWLNWCKKNTWWGWPTRFFFWMSDYGTSATKIIISFFSLTFIFAAIYYLCGLFGQGVIANLFKVGEINLPCWKVLFRVVYFSVVTMTTLGFGDMYANSQSIVGHILLTVQVLFGYVLLGALITRLAIVFTGEGPALDSVFDMDKKRQRAKPEKN